MTHRKFRMAVAQTICRCGDVEGNLERILEAVEAAKREKVDHIQFAELAVTGYIVDDTFSDFALRLDGPRLKRLRDASAGIAISVGFIEETATSMFYNSAACFHDGRLRHLHRKIYLPTYGMFDEKRYYGAGWDVSAFDLPHARTAMLICGDAWHLALPYMAAHDGADVLQILASSSEKGLSATTSCEGAWQRMCQSYALTLSCFVTFCNQANGSNPDLRHWGGSMIVRPDGNVLAESTTDGPDLVIGELDMKELRDQRIRLPFRRDDSLVHTIELGQRTLRSKLDRDRFYATAHDNDEMPPPKPK